MDKTMAIKLVAGTLARGLLWASAALATKLGIDAAPQATVESVAYFAAAAIIAGLSAYWSSRKNGKLLATEPPTK